MSSLSRALRSRATSLMLLALLFPISASPAAGEEDARDRLVLRVFHVGALTMGQMNYRGERPPPVGPHEVSDEERPLFGAPDREPVYPVGQVDELIELIQGMVQPRSWETIEEAELRSMGERALVARNRPEVLDEVARWLARLEERVLGTATIEVRAMHGAGDGTKAAVGPSLSMTAFLNQRASGFSGSQYAYVQDYDVEVAQDSDISDPIVGVANLGLGVDARIMPGGSVEHVTVEVDVRLSSLASTRQVTTGEHRSVEVPAFDVTTAKAVLHVVPGQWTPLAGREGEGGWSFELRVTRGQATLPVASSAGFRVRAAERVDTDALPPVRMFPVYDLLTRTSSSVGNPIFLLPSNYTPPEPDELADPCPIFPQDHTVELIRRASQQSSWEDPMSIEARNGLLIVRNHPTVLASLEGLLAQMRREFKWSVRTQMDVLEMPAAMLEGLRQGARGAAVLTSGQVRSFDAEFLRGAIRRLGRVHVSSHDGVPNTIRSGRHTAYMADYQVEVAEKSNISNPVIQSFFSGLQLVVTAGRTSGDGAVAMDIRATQSRHELPLRRMEAPRGYIELPQLDIFRVHTGLLVPAGGAVLLAAQGDGEMRRVLLLTPVIERQR